MTFYEIRIEFRNETDPSYEEMQRIIREAFENEGWEFTSEGVQIFNEDYNPSKGFLLPLIFLLILRC